MAQRILTARAAGLGWGEVAVFYRTNAQSRVMEDALRRAGIPYLIVGGVRFYERKEVKDALAYLRLIVNPADDAAFLRAVQEPGRGVGRTTLVRLQDVAAHQGQSLLTLAAAPPPDVTGRPRRSLEGFAALVARLREERAGLALPAVIDLLLEVSGYREALKQERTAEAESRLENLNELVAGAEDFELAQMAREGGAPGEALEDFLDQVALVSDVDELKEGARGVTLMTLHAAKGLEFPVVFLTGMEEGVFPHARSLHHTADIEEERRLCYVGLTRAPEAALSLLRPAPAASRVGGRQTVAVPGGDSRGRADPPERAAAGLAGPGGVVCSRGGGLRAGRRRSPFSVGAHVRHAQWGEGLVVGVERTGSDTIVTVRFASVGRKRLSLQYAHLEDL